MELLDELYAGVPAVGSPAIQQSFAASYSGVAWAILLAPAILGLVLEPIFFLLADRYPRRWFVTGGLLAMAGAAFAAALAPNVWVLAAAVSVSSLAAGCSVTLVQAILVDASPCERERVMTRWVLFGQAGDLAAPIMVAVLVDWRLAYAAVGGLVLAIAILITRHRFPPSQAEEEEPAEGLIASLRTALANRRLMLWLGGCALCDLLDEMLVVFASLHLRDVVGAGSGARSAILVGFVAGGTVGVAVTERLLARVAPVRLIAVSSALCAVLYLAWIAVTDLWLSAALFAAVGATAAPLYPLAMAHAYAAMPGRSGAVNAAANLFTPVTLALPWLLGAIADAHGTGAALLLLAAQPVGLALVSACSSTGRPR